MKIEKLKNSHGTKVSQHNDTSLFFFFWHERMKIYHKSIKYYSQELIKLVLEEKKQVYLLYIHEQLEKKKFQKSWSPNLRALVLMLIVVPKFKTIS